MNQHESFGENELWGRIEWISTILEYPQGQRVKKKYEIKSTFEIKLTIFNSWEGLKDIDN